MDLLAANGYNTATSVSLLFGLCIPLCGILVFLFVYLKYSICRRCSSSVTFVSKHTSQNTHGPTHKNTNTPNPCVHKPRRTFSLSHLHLARNITSRSMHAKYRTARKSRTLRSETLEYHRDRWNRDDDALLVACVSGRGGARVRYASLFSSDCARFGRSLCDLRVPRKIPCTPGNRRCWATTAWKSFSRARESDARCAHVKSITS